MDGVHKMIGYSIGISRLGVESQKFIPIKTLQTMLSTNPDKTVLVFLNSSYRPIGESISKGKIICVESADLSHNKTRQNYPKKEN
jgi:hypothetical protein